MASMMLAKALTRGPALVVQRSLATATAPTTTRTIAQQYSGRSIEDHSVLFHPKTWVKYWELTPVVAAMAFAGGICGSYIIYAFCKEEIHINPFKKIAPYEDYHHEHRTHLVYPNGPRKSKVPEDIVELKKQLGPYKAY